MAHVKRSAPVVRFWIERICDERRRVRGDAGIHVVAVVQRFGKRINAAELQTSAEAAVHVHFEPVVGTDALGKPMGGIPHRAVRKRRVGRVIKRPCRIAGPGTATPGRSSATGRLASTESNS